MLGREPYIWFYEILTIAGWQAPFGDVDVTSGAIAHRLQPICASLNADLGQARSDVRDAGGLDFWVRVLRTRPGMTSQNVMTQQGLPPVGTFTVLAEAQVRPLTASAAALRRRRGLRVRSGFPP
jgi:hypothetical protein